MSDIISIDEFNVILCYHAFNKDEYQYYLDPKMGNKFKFYKYNVSTREYADEEYVPIMSYDIKPIVESVSQLLKINGNYLIGLSEKSIYKIYENIKKIMMDECNEIFVKKYERKEKSIRKNKMIEIML